MDPDMILVSSLVITMVLGGGKSHPDQYSPSGSPSDSVAHESKQDPRRWSSPLESAWHSMATGAMGINTDTGYCGTRDPDMAFGSSPGGTSP